MTAPPAPTFAGRTWQLRRIESLQHTYASSQPWYDLVESATEGLIRQCEEQRAFEVHSRCEFVLFSFPQQQTALGYNLSMQGMGIVAIDGPRFQELLRSRKAFLRSCEGVLAMGSRNNFLLGCTAGLISRRFKKNDVGAEDEAQNGVVAVDISSNRNQIMSNVTITMLTLMEAVVSKFLIWKLMCKLMLVLMLLLKLI